MEIQIPSSAKPKAKAINVQVERQAPVAHQPRISPEAAIEMALAGDLAPPVAALVSSFSPLDGKIVLQESMDFMTDTLTFFLNDPEASENPREAYHRILTCATNLVTVSKLMGLDDTKILVLLREATAAWDDYQEFWQEENQPTVGSQMVTHEEDDEEYEEEEHDGDEPMLHHPTPEIDRDPSIEPYDIGVRPEYLDTPDSAVCLGADAFVYGQPVDNALVSSLLEMANVRLNAGDMADLVVFAPSFSEDSHQAIIEFNARGRTRIKPVEVSVVDIEGWAEAELSVNVCTQMDLWPSHDLEANGMPTMRRVARLQLAELHPLADQSEERDDD